MKIRSLPLGIPFARFVQLAQEQIQSTSLILSYIIFKGTIAPDFGGPFLACMDRSEGEKEPLLGFFTYFSVGLLIFGDHFKVLLRLKGVSSEN